MVDYRFRPEDSPFVWSPQLSRLVASNLATSVMKTVFHVDDTGIFPYGNVNIENLETATATATVEAKR